MTRRQWIAPMPTIALKRQCALAGVSRATVYALRKPKTVDENDPMLLGLIDQEYTRHPFYGSRKMVVYLGQCGHSVNRKRVQRLMRSLGLQGMAPGPNTSRSHPQHKVYPYLLRGVAVDRPNQVWSTDITYIRLAKGFVYLVAIMDWYSRAVLSWRLSNSMEAVFCVDCLEDALRMHGKPEIFNTDQGSQFTSEAFTDVLKCAGVSISMDGRGRAFDNIFVERLWRSVKHEDVYLKGYATMGELHLGLTQYFAFYNEERPHQALEHQTPLSVYRSASGGGALIIDIYGSKAKAQALSPAVDKAPAPNRCRSVGTAPAGCVPCPPLPGTDALALAKQPVKMKTKNQNKTGPAPSCCIST